MTARILLLLALLCSAAFAGWSDQTADLKGPMVTVKSDKGQHQRFDLSQKKPALLVLKKKTSSRFIIRADKPGTLTITREGKVIKTLSLKAGNQSLKIFLEPGSYAISATTAGTLKYLSFRKVKMAPLSPLGGGYPVYVSNSKKGYTYFKVGRDTLPVLKVMGPSVAYVFVRAVPKDAAKTSVDVSIREGATVVAHRIETVAVSAKMFVIDPKTGIKGSIKQPAAGAPQFLPPGTKLSDAVTLTFKVPAGLHQYTVSLKEGTGITKFYKKPSPKHSTAKKAAKVETSAKKKSLFGR